MQKLFRSLTFIGISVIFFAYSNISFCSNKRGLEEFSDEDDSPKAKRERVSTNKEVFFDNVLEEEKKIKAVNISNPCIDSIFQYGFAEPTILSDFLNAVLELKEDESIEDIEYLPKDMTSANPISSLSYHFTVDIRCRTKKGHHFLIEMQNDFRDDYHMKSLVEHARMVSRLDVDQNMSDQDLRSEKNKKDTKRFWKGIQGLYAIVITNKAFLASKMKGHYSDESIMEPLLVNPYELRHIKNLDRHYGDVPNQIILLMLDNLKKSAQQLSSPIERWSYLFKDPSLRTGVHKISETKEILDPAMIAGDDKAIKAFIERIDIEKLPQNVRESYIRSLNYYNGSILDIEEKAMEKGKAEALVKVVQNLLKQGLSIQNIASATELSSEEIKKIQEETNKSGT